MSIILRPVKTRQDGKGDAEEPLLPMLDGDLAAMSLEEISQISANANANADSSGTEAEQAAKKAIIFEELTKKVEALTEITKQSTNTVKDALAEQHSSSSGFVAAASNLAAALGDAPKLLLSPKDEGIVGDEEEKAIIEKPMDGMSILNLERRERGWKQLARKMYNVQPPFLDRGKQRWNGFIEYDLASDRVLWNKKPLPNSRLWKSTFDHSEYNVDRRPWLGETILVLMEKNESKIIERMLASIIDDIDGFIILDTGSTDGTEQVMWNFLVEKHKKPGAIYRCDWYDFGTNRTITVQLAHNVGKWLVLMDADYRLERTNKVEPQDWKKHLPPLDRAPAWLLLNTTGDLEYARPHVVQGCVRWCYVCRTHEYLSRSVHDKSNCNFRQEMFPHLKIDHVGDGQSKSDKMGRDIVLLLMDQMDDPKSERASFYLANTLKQIRMPDWGLRAYKHAMNHCGWNEELYMSSKGALECMFQMSGVSFERMLGMALHGMTQNPERLEMLSMFIRKIRNTKDWWPKYSHICSSLMAFMTHNTYPSHQKLFIEKGEHDFGYWQEMGIVSYYNPIYFELGLFASRKILELPAFQEQVLPVKQQNSRNRQLYEQRLQEWRDRGVILTPPVRAYILEQGHKAFAQGKWAKAKEWYQHVLHPVVASDRLPDHLLPTNQDQKVLSDVCDALSSPDYHKTACRLTAWTNAKIMTSTINEADYDRALACFQMGQAQYRIEPDNRILAAFHYMDALKFVPCFPPALSAMYDLTIHKPSEITRCIHYMIRLVSISPAMTNAQTMLKRVKNTMESMANDQSEWIHPVQHPLLLATPWLVPIKREAPVVEDTDMAALDVQQHLTKSTTLHPAWNGMSFIQPSLFTLVCS